MCNKEKLHTIRQDNEKLNSPRHTSTDSKQVHPTVFGNVNKSRLWFWFNFMPFHSLSIYQNWYRIWNHFMQVWVTELQNIIQRDYSLSLWWKVIFTVGERALLHGESCTSATWLISVLGKLEQLSKIHLLSEIWALSWEGLSTYNCHWIYHLSESGP